MDTRVVFGNGFQPLCRPPSPGRLFAVGGSDDKDHLATAEVFDPSTNCWKLISPMSVPRRGLGLCQLSGPIYAIGGMDNISFFNTVERYDAQSNTWSSVAPMKSPRGGVAVAVLKVYIIQYSTASTASGMQLLRWYHTLYTSND